jgi:hypothetical protein
MDRIRFQAGSHRKRRYEKENVIFRFLVKKRILASNYDSTTTYLVFRAPPKQNNNNNNNNKNKNATCEVRDVFLFSCVSELCYSPPFPCLTVAGRERGAGTSSTGIVVRAQE